MLHLKHGKCKYGSKQSVTSPAGFPLWVCLQERPVCLYKQEVLCFPCQCGFPESRGHLLSGLMVSIHPTADTPVQRSESNAVVREGVGALNAKTHGNLCLSSARRAASTTRGGKPCQLVRAGDICQRFGCSAAGLGAIRRSFPEAEPRLALPDALSTS